MKFAKAAAVAAITVAFCSSTTVAATADDSPRYRLILTAGQGAYHRTEPMFDARTGTAWPEGSMIAAACWLYGQTVTNPYLYSSRVWIRDVDGLYWPEVWLDTGGEGVPVGLPECGAQTTPSAPPIANSFYNRFHSVEWALENAPRDPSSGYRTPSCTWFVSNALWRGGFPQDNTWTSTGTNGRLRVVPGSVTAWSVIEFYSYLTSHFDVTTVDLTPDRFRSNAVPEAWLGDLIVYDWDGDGTWDHFTIVTAIAPGDYPEVSEWGVSNNYVKRGWTYSVNSDRWLQRDNPNVTAQLIHINGGHWTEIADF